jgi:hypothetical protein
MAGSTLPQLTEPHQQNANWRSIPGLEQRLDARFATQSCSSRRPQRAAEMGWKAEVRPGFLSGPIGQKSFANGRLECDDTEGESCQVAVDQ